MTKREFIDFIAKTYEKGIKIIERKNSDYANSSNPFRNFESANIVGLSVSRAILVRILDKLSRISNLLDKADRDEEAAVKDEAIEDTILDCINYLAILMAYLESQNYDKSCEELSSPIQRKISEPSDAEEK